MKILIVGGTGTIGQAVVEELASRHEVITAGFKSGDVQVDISSTDSIKKMYKHIGKCDAVISATGHVHFGAFPDMDLEKYKIGINNKLLGQVDLVLEGINYLNDKGSFTLTSGILNVDPIPAGSSAAMVNGALEGFVTGVAIELPRSVRINLVSPTVITEAMEDYAPFFRGYESVAAARAALAYSKSVEGLQTGQTFRVGY